MSLDPFDKRLYTNKESVTENRLAPLGDAEKTKKELQELVYLTSGIQHKLADLKQKLELIFGESQGAPGNFELSSNSYPLAKSIYIECKNLQNSLQALEREVRD